MKKIIIWQLIICLSFSWLQIKPAQAYNQNSLAEYLNAHNTSAWSVMGLAALGENNINANHLKNINASDAISLTAPILAITAINQNPSTFANSDYVANLKNFYSQGQLGDPSLLNDDIFGLLALVAAGENTQSEIITSLKNNIIEHQNADYGWGFMIGANSDTNMTAAAIIALKASQIDANHNGLQNAWQYLRNQQQADGGFTYDNASQNSDSASTAWVLWSLNAWQIPSSEFIKNGNNPTTYLENLQSNEGYFLYQSGGQVDNFTPTVSAYAALALSQHTLPINIFVANQNIPEYNFRIEGANNTVCQGKAAGPTALDIVINASSLCGFSYHITETAYGPYLDQINNDIANGLIGWMYLVNYLSPSVGAADYQLKDDDTILWYFGSYEWLASQISVSNQTIGSGGTIIATVQTFNNNQWQALANATIYFGAQNITTNAQGQAQLSMPDGYYRIYAEANGHIRSNQILITVGEAGGENVGLSVNINNGETPLPEIDLLSFVVEPGNIDFGNLSPGQNAQREIHITNNGSEVINIASTVNGDQIFVDKLQVNNQAWSLFNNAVEAGQTFNTNLKLSIPNNYQTSGQKTGTITFWSN